MFIKQQKRYSRAARTDMETDLKFEHGENIEYLNFKFIGATHLAFYFSCGFIA